VEEVFPIDLLLVDVPEPVAVSVVELEAGNLLFVLQVSQVVAVFELFVLLVLELRVALVFLLQNLTLLLQILFLVQLLVLQTIFLFLFL